VTDPDRESPPWAPVLRKLTRTSGHELRNALNALVVNLEVVRSRSGEAGPAVQPFIAQAVEQSEESVRLAEATIALLNLIVGAVGTDGRVDCELLSPRSVRIRATGGEAERAGRFMRAVAARTGIAAEPADSAVILTIPDTNR